MDVSQTTKNDIISPKEPALPKVPRHSNALRLCLFLGLPLLLAAAYALGCVYFDEHFYPYTYINGKDVSLMTLEQAHIAIDRPNDYTLEIVGRNDLTDKINAEQIDFNYEIDPSFFDLLPDQSPFLFFTSIFYNSSYNVNYLTSYNDDLLEQAIGGLTFFAPANIKKPENAYVDVYDKRLGEFPIVPEKKGANPLRNKFYSAVKDCIASGASSLILDDADVYEKPAITAEEDLITYRYNERNGYLKLNVTYDFGSGREEIVDKNVVSDWLLIEDGDISIDEAGVKEYVDALAKKYDTYGSERKFTTINGEVKSFSKGRNRFGYKIDRAEEIKNLISYIKEGTQIKTSPTFSNEGAVLAADDIGDSYVEIDLGNQHLYAKIDGQIVLESDFVSGNVSKGYTTPEGAYSLTYRKKKAVLRGEDYTTPVNYWMPFNYGIGMHDATWRRTFGGGIYLTNGSHGCINMPLAKAKAMYELVYTGMPIICYY